jgi:hypothetical protein
MNYQQFIERKSQVGNMSGFEPIWIPDFLFDFQKSLVDWAIQKGRAGIFAGCGLGKTPMQLAWADNVVRHTNKPVLILTPLAVAAQTVREGAKFGIECKRSLDGTLSGKIIVANYDRLHYFNPHEFAGVVADESACMKDFDSKRTADVTEFMRTVNYRLLCTATPAPNDYVELGTSAEALGELGSRDMITKFFRQQTAKDHLGWGRTKYILKGHAVHDFWRWVCSWGRAVRKPADLGFENGDFDLPELKTTEHVIQTAKPRPGLLFPLPAITMQEERAERRHTINERCELVDELVKAHDSSLVWCHLNPEGDLLAKLIPDSAQISGADADESKEEKILAFISGQIKRLISKPVILCWGLNFQHCAHETFFPSHSFEQFFQAVPRCWRFGQKRIVHVDMVTSEGERGVLENLQRKAKQADLMFEQLVLLMNDHLNIRRTNPFTNQAEAPPWIMSSTKKSRTTTLSIAATAAK